MATQAPVPAFVPDVSTGTSGTSTSPDFIPATPEEAASLQGTPQKTPQGASPDFIPATPQEAASVKAATAPRPTGNFFQRFVDQFSTANRPEESQLNPVVQAASNFGGKVIGAFTTPFSHPEQTAKGLYQSVMPDEGTAGTVEKLAGPEGPLLYHTVKGLADEYQKEGLAATLGTLTGSYLFGKALPGGEVDPKVAINKITAAIGGKLSKEVGNTIDDLTSTAQKQGIQVNNLDDLQNVIGGAKDGINDEFNTALAPVQHVQVMPAQIERNLQELITPDMEMTPEGRAEIAQIKDKIISYQQPWTLQQLNSLRMKLGSQMNTFYNKSNLGQYTAAKSNIEVAMDKAIADGSRDIVYDALDKAPGLPKGYIRSLKSRQGDLIKIEDQLKEHATNIADKTATIQGTPRLSRANFGLHATGSGLKGNLYGLAGVIKKENPAGAANSLASGAFQSVATPVPARFFGMLPQGHMLNPQPQPEQQPPVPISANAPR